MCPACLSTLAITVLSTTGALATVTAVVKGMKRSSNPDHARVERDLEEKGTAR